MMKGTPIFLSLILLSIIQCLNSLPDEPRESMKLELIHKHAPQYNARPITQLESIKELLRNDIIRLNIISHKIRLSQKPRRKALEMSTSNNDAAIMSLYSGTDYVPGLYFATLKIGTPFQKLKLIVDTGSDLSWLNCRYQSKDDNKNECGDAKCRYHRRVFLADFSSSFKPIPCHSPMCEVDLKHFNYEHHNCSTTEPFCPYDCSYFDRSATTGFLFNETVTVALTNGGKAKVDNVMFGCSTSFVGGGSEKTDGLLGLSYTNYTFASKLTERFGGKFSYCLVDHLSHKNVSNYLIFGANYNKQSLLSNMSYTKLEVGLFGQHYGVNVVGISIGGVMLNIPIEEWKLENGGATIVDSGTTLSILIQSAYNAVTKTLMKSLSNFKRVTVKDWDLEYCFIATGFEESMVPRLAFHFADGARFEPHVKGYIIDFDYEQGVKCIGLQSENIGANIIGNRLQQNYLWEFDVRGQKLGFAASTCA